ncbi:MAG: shikimate dehydrogenase [Phycisphaeraceae bacterium]|nr:shikimate dehydrogenase [Phycisphaeraceae bacterium]
MTHLAVSIMVQNLDQALAGAALAAEQGADLVEFRIDAFTDRPDLVAVLAERSALPCIITCRPDWEGGAFSGDEATRLRLLEGLADTARPPSYIDLELAAIQRTPDLRRAAAQVVDHPGQLRPTSTGLIFSSHDFESRPIDLYQRIEAMAAAPLCRVIKVAWMARTIRDNLEAFEIIAQRHKPTIALCMGEDGLASRVLARKFGALLTFACLDAGAATAAGQPTVPQLKQLYRWDAINEETRVYGVIGDPVGHSMSPAIHNAGFGDTGYDGIYLPLRIDASYESFKATVASWLGLEGLHFSGASVTIPHKENLLRFVREAGGEVEPLAERIGAANTLAVAVDGALSASNTDYAAALDAVCDRLQCTRDGLAGERVAVIGAGGAARAVVAGFAHHGATVVVYNRTFEKAEALAAQCADEPGKVVAARLEKLCDSCCRIYINCTPIGMHPQTDGTPLPDERPRGWGAGTVVFDTIYNPVETRLLREARADGCEIISGVDMFVRQAAAQFELWTGTAAPRGLFRRVVMEMLG